MFAAELMLHDVPCPPDSAFLLDVSHDLFKPGGRGFSKSQTAFTAYCAARRVRKDENENE